jgi:hypothetical protein
MHAHMVEAVGDRHPALRGSEQLAAVQRGTLALADGIGAYEDAMREYVYPIMEMSADHDRFGGGGLRREPA